MENILLPNNVTYTEKSDREGTLVMQPCYHGYGTTIGNAIRRVLLSSLPGAAVTGVRVKGVPHEFSTVPGVKEDMVEIILNLKELRLRCFSNEEVVLRLQKKGAGPVIAGDITKIADVEIANEDLVIATISDEKAEIDMEIIVQQGRGYGSVEMRDKKSLPLGTIAIDALYSPVKDVGYKVEFVRVGDITNYEKLTIDITTDGTISPRESLEQSVGILLDHFNLLTSLDAKKKEKKSEDAAME